MIIGQNDCLRFAVVSDGNRDSVFSGTGDIPIPLQIIYPVVRSFFHEFRISLHLIVLLKEDFFLVQKIYKPLFDR